MDWTNCKECVSFEDCDNKEDRNGCYFGEQNNTED